VSRDKSKLLTQNVLLLQRDMENDVKTMREQLKQDLKKKREEQRLELQNMKVSFPKYIQMCTTLHSFIPVLFSCPQTLYPKFISCILGTIVLFILHLNYQKLH
jgi:hypothetical protein